MTLNDPERRNGRVVCAISSNPVALAAYYVEVVEDTPIHSASEMKPKESSFRRYIIYSNICRESPSEGVKLKQPPCR